VIVTFIVASQSLVDRSTPKTIQYRNGAKTGAFHVADSAALHRPLLPPAQGLWHHEPRAPPIEVVDIRARTARTFERRALRIESRGTRGRLSKNR